MSWVEWIVAAVAVYVAYILLSAGYRLYFRTTIRRRLAYIDNYEWPDGLLEKLAARHPHLSVDDAERISKGLKQFFRAYLRSGRQYVAMPSQAADDLWHEFILYTRAYQDFCKKAFGRFLHHTPAAVLAPEHKKSDEGLRRVWAQSCRDANIDPLKPAMLPLLFALDSKLQIPNGIIYGLDSESLRASGLVVERAGVDGSSTTFFGVDGGFGDTGDAGVAGGDGGGGSCGGGGCGGGS